MPHGVHSSKRPSGYQQRKAKKAKQKAQKLSGGMDRYVMTLQNGQSSKDTAAQPTGNEPGFSGASVHSAKKRALEVAEFVAEDTAALPLHSTIDDPGFSGESTHSPANQLVEMADYVTEETCVLQSTFGASGPSAEIMHSVEERAEEIAEMEAQEIGSNHMEYDMDSSGDGNLMHDAVDDLSARRDREFQSLCDISFWDIPVPDHLRIAIIKKGSESFQNKNGPFGGCVRPGSQEVRRLSKQWFYHMSGGKKVLRTWMAYSTVSKKLYCFCCKLFATHVQSVFVTGFQTWWKLNPRIVNHERSKGHDHSLEKWKALASGIGQLKAIDSVAISAMDREKKKWRDILFRLLCITKFLARQNLPFRGHREDESSVNKGNFLVLAEMLTDIDPVMRDHFEKSNQSQGSVTYLSPQTQNEFISVLASHVREKLVMDIKSEGFFGIMFDTTPDMSHIDQMSEVIRYVKTSNNIVEVKEVFLRFVPLEGKKAADISSEILKTLELDGLDIMMCRGQGYDNAATMSGTHGGVQSHIKERNRKALYIGCVNHSLNLCGRHAFDINPACSTFFGTLERMYSLFASSTQRWHMLLKRTGVSVKRLATTRWSAHRSAVQPLKEKYDEFVAAIEDVCEARDQSVAREMANGILHAACDFTFLCYLYFWGDVLHEVDITQQKLQTKGISLDKVLSELESLRLFLHTERSHLVDHAIEQALKKAEEHGIEVQKRPRTKKRMPGEQASDVGLSLQDENKRAMLECIDHFHCQLEKRTDVVKEIAAIFHAVEVGSLMSGTEEELKVSVPKLTNFYDEVSEMELFQEIPRLRRYLTAKGINFEDAKKTWASVDVLSFIVTGDHVDALPNLTLSLKLFLTMCVSVASCERSFSKLKLIKNYLRSTMGQSRLSDLALLSIENEFVKGIDFGEVIDKFAAVRARKKV